MTEPRSTYTTETDGHIVNSALTRFSVSWLSLLLKLFDDVCEESGFGGLEIVICDGKIQTIKKVISCKAK